MSTCLVRGVWVVLAVGFWCAPSGAAEVTYDKRANYVPLLAADSIELGTQLWLRFRQHAQPADIKDLPAPVIGFEWSGGGVSCRVRAIPTIGTDAHDRTAVGYYIDFSAEALTAAGPETCRKIANSLNVWLVTVAASMDEKVAIREIHVKDFRAADPRMEVRWRTRTGEDLMKSADKFIESVTRGKQ